MQPGSYLSGADVFSVITGASQGLATAWRCSPNRKLQTTNTIRIYNTTPAGPALFQQHFSTNCITLFQLSAGSQHLAITHNSLHITKTYRDGTACWDKTLQKQRDKAIDMLSLCVVSLKIHNRSKIKTETFTYSHTSQPVSLLDWHGKMTF